MEERHRRSAERARSAIERGAHDPRVFRSALLDVPPADRDGWVDVVLGLGELPDDGPLPVGCVPYLPCGVDVLLRMIDRAGVTATDVLVDVGSGPGRAAAIVHLLTGAAAIGIEIQPALVRSARELASRLRLDRVTFVEGDAGELTGEIPGGSVYLLYCPFGGDRLARVLDDLGAAARTRPLRVCCVDLPLPPQPWLTPDPEPAADLAVHRSTPHAGM